MSIRSAKKENKKPADGNKRHVTFVKFDANKKSAYIKLLSTGGRRHVSARAVGVHPATVVNHMHSDPAFAESVSMAEMESDDEVEDALRMAAISGNVTAALAWLYSRRPERWSDMRKQLNVNVDWRVEARQSGMSEEQANAIYAAMVEAARTRLVESGGGGSDTGSEAHGSE